ncbi:MAG TPA: cytochrome c biogenesis protein [Candidatus Xenobia bacterium]|nr:cytochrome c biogenesis protein [Candidatus Xenobia bacterium]
MSESTYQRLTPALVAATLVLLLVALYQVFFVVPTEKTMGVVQRIFYIHMPSAVVSFNLFFVVFVCSIAYLRTRRLGWDRVAVSAAEVGTIFCAAVLITGPLWAKPVWGIWWAWDPRLTTTLILFLIFVGYLMLRVYVEDPNRRALLSAVVGIIGFVDVPIVYIANRFRGQHPKPVIGGGEGSGLAPEMWVGLIWCLVALHALGLLLFLQRYRLETLSHELNELYRRVRA